MGQDAWGCWMPAHLPGTRFVGLGRLRDLSMNKEAGVHSGPGTPARACLTLEVGWEVTECSSLRPQSCLLQCSVWGCACSLGYASVSCHCVTSHPNPTGSKRPPFYYLLATPGSVVGPGLSWTGLPTTWLQSQGPCCSIRAPRDQQHTPCWGLSSVTSPSFC